MSHLTKINGLKHCKTKARPMADLRGSRHFQNEDLSGWCLFGIDGRGLDLSGCSGANVDLRCANLKSANLHSADLSGWDLTGAVLTGANLDGSTIGATLDGARMESASVVGVTWLSGGRRCYGLRLPTVIPFETWRYGCGCHPVMARALQQLFPDDPEVDLLINAVLAEPFRYEPTLFPCWRGGLAYLESHLSHRMDEMVTSAREAYPGMLMAERLELARLLASTDDPTVLKNTVFYDLFKFDIDLACRMRLPR